MQDNVSQTKLPESCQTVCENLVKHIGFSVQFAQGTVTLLYGLDVTIKLICP